MFGFETARWPVPLPVELRGTNRWIRGGSRRAGDGEDPLALDTVCPFGLYTLRSGKVEVLFAYLGFT